MPTSAPAARRANIFRSHYLRLWIMLAISVLGIFAFAMVAFEILQATRGDVRGALAFDGEILQFFASRRTPLLNRVMTDLTSLGSFSVITALAVLMFALLFSLKDKLGAAHLAIVLFGAATIPSLLKNIFSRPRPSVVEHIVTVSDSSFPSGHSFGSACVYLTLAFFASRHRAGTGFEAAFLLLFSTLIALVGLSRMYLGVHYPTDVFAGFCGGAAWALLVASAFYPLYRRAPRTDQHAGPAAK